jgi:hypothetical protein
MPEKKDKKSLMRFIGMVSFLARWITHLADIKRPLRDDVEWQCSNEHRKAVQQIKSLLTAAPVLQFFEPEKQAFIECDANSSSLGAVLLQNDRPIAFASRALTDAESRYAQIEKELLAIVFAAEKFEHYIYGADKTLVLSDHRPLQHIFKTALSKTSPRLHACCCASFDSNWESSTRQARPCTCPTHCHERFCHLRRQHVTLKWQMTSTSQYIRCYMNFRSVTVASSKFAAKQPSVRSCRNSRHTCSQNFRSVRRHGNWRSTGKSPPTSSTRTVSCLRTARS